MEGGVHFPVSIYKIYIIPETIQYMEYKIYIIPETIQYMEYLLPVSIYKIYTYNTRDYIVQFLYIKYI